MDSLYINHNIFLDKDQRYKLAEGKRVSVIGTSLSMLSSDKFKDPKDFSEYFCLYNLIPKKTIFKNVYNTKQGYDIHLLNSNTKNSAFDYFKNFIFNKNENQQEVRKLVDIKDGGVEWMLIFEQDYKKQFIVFHKIQIQKIEVLLESLT
jgi:hypothetical protein